MLDIGEDVDGRYQVVRIIGAGGMGQVVEVVDGDGEPYALKYCKEGSEKSRRRFAREVRIMAAIHHRHVVPVVASNFNYHPPYFVMPLARGTLEDEIADLSRDEDAAIGAFQEVCRGIRAIHNSAAVHRDIKPLNALRLDDGRIVVSDLGLARFHDRDTTTLTQAGDFLGTRIYCAPEQLIGGRDADERTDIFQLGKTLYQLLTGQNPALIDPLLISSGLRHIVQRATKENPSERYQNIGELLDALHYYRSSKDPNNKPRETLAALYQQAQDNLSRNEYDADNVVQMLDILGRGDLLGPESILELFDEIPERLLPVMAENFCEQLLPALREYLSAVRAAIAGYGFSYAETVAKRMRILFQRSKNPEVRTLALCATMNAAVLLHRFAAMDVFNELLQQVTSEEAIPVAEMLRDHAHVYRAIAQAIPSERLDPAVRAVKQLVLGTGESAEEL